ncbi:hypothetical protein ONZ43_g1077 [Nemania bipapillata]|uniref:Uncharacterized protein n=1 Tax=Nemania bipapillata TaxID=110536 RepID=A0ACC2J5V1_9PEZI|nr:hypothetical protein ONZ43_g1077 [Nemania bipapillata]
MASRESIDSAYSASPLIQDPAFQPSSKHHEGHVKAVGDNAPTKFKISTLVGIFRLAALISGFVMSIKLSILGGWRPEGIVLIVFSWVTFGWDALMVSTFLQKLQKPSFQISLVLGNGRRIPFGPTGEGNSGEKHSRYCPRAFWIDLLLVILVLSFNVTQSFVGGWYYHDYYSRTVALNWIPISFHLVIVLLTMFPSFGMGHVRFETVEMPQIALP